MENQFKNTTDVRTIASIGALFLFLVLLSSITKIHIPNSNQQIVENHNAFSNVEIEAKSAVVYDILDQKIIYEKDSLAPRPLASITKLMTALAAKKILGQGGTVIVTKNSLRTEGDSGLRPGEKFAIQRLIDFTLTSSSNDGSQAIAGAAAAKIPTDSTFPENMNIIAKEVGLKGLLFENPTGLDDSIDNAGAYGTAVDVAKLLAYIAKYDPELISATRYTSIKTESENRINHIAKNTNDAIPYIPGLIGGKTGFTDLSGGNLAVIFDPGLGHPYAIVVLGSSESGRFEDMKKLVFATINNSDLPLSNKFKN